jgi:hypothetical protein
MRNYLQKNKGAFDSIAKEVLGLANPYWSLHNYGNGFIPSYQVVPNRNWEALSKSTQHRLEVIDADFRKEFGQSSWTSIMATGGMIREDGRRDLTFHLEHRGLGPEETLAFLLSYFPDGVAGTRDDRPYVDFGDGWHFYCGVWV